MACEKDSGRRRKKMQLGLKNVRSDRFAYNQYVDRKSILDQACEDSMISQSPFKGLLRLLLMITFMMCLNSFLVRTFVISQFSVSSLQRRPPSL